MTSSNANFGFLQSRAPALFQLAVLAEHYFPTDPNTSLIKLRQFGEVMAKEVAAQTGLLERLDDSQADLLRRFKADRIAPQEVVDLLHHLRAVGNRAVHHGADSHGEALSALKVARQLAVWFHRFDGAAASFHPGPFAPPRPPPDPSADLRDELARLKGELAAVQSAAERAKADADAAALALLTAEDRLRREADDRATWETLAQDTDRQVQRLAADLATLQAKSLAAPARVKQVIQRGEDAAALITLDEAATRTLIDQQLREAQWRPTAKACATAKARGPPRASTAPSPSGRQRAARRIMPCLRA